MTLLAKRKYHEGEFIGEDYVAVGSFGDNLRREREMREVTLEEISAATRISVRFLQAIEAEQFSTLPGGIFTRSFIRAYAKYLGLDEERVLTEFQLIAGPREVFIPSRLNIAKASPAADPSKSTIAAVLVAAVLLSGGYALYRRARRVVGTASLSNSAPLAGTPYPSAVADQSQNGSPGSAAPVTSSPTPADGSPPGLKRRKGDAPDTPIRPSIQPTSAPIVTQGLEGNNELVLQVAATERVWVGVDTDGKTALQRVLYPKEVETLKAKQFFDVTTGNAEGVVLTLNGETLKSLGRRGEVKSVHLTHDDLKNP